MHASSRLRRFGFDQVFETVAPTIEALDDGAMRLRLLALEADIALLRSDGAAAAEQARGEGFAAGLAEARGEQQAALLAVADAVHAAVERVETHLDAIADETAGDAARVAHAAAEMLAARALVETPAAAIDEAIGRALRQVTRGQEIHVAADPRLVADLEALVAIRQAGDRRRLAVSISGDPSIATGDARIEWHRGGMVLDAAARRAAVAEALAPLLAGD